MERNLYDYRDVEASYEQVSHVLASQQERLLGDATDQAATQSHEAASELTATIAGFDVGRDIEVQTGPPQELGPHAMQLPLRWTSAHAPSLFPAMEGFLEISAQSDHPPRTQVAFIGHYTPPGGVVGALGDAVVGHNVAQSAIAHLLDEVAARITAAVASSQTA